MVTFVSPAGPQAPNEAEPYPILVYGQDLLVSTEVALAFTDQDSFVVAARHLHAWPKIERVLETLASIDNVRALADEALVKRLQREAIDHVERGIRQLAETLGEPEATDAVHVRAALGRHPLEPPVFDPVLLYDLPFETSPPRAAPEGTRTLPLPTGWWPHLGWFGWNDRARGSRIFGNAVLYEHAWFQGRQLWLFGLNGLIPLRPLFFDRIATSAVVY